MVQHNPDTEDIYEDNLLDTPSSETRDVCLYDLVANYNWQNRDDDGNRKYTKLKEPRHPIHKLFDPQRRIKGKTTTL